MAWCPPGENVQQGKHHFHWTAGGGGTDKDNEWGSYEGRRTDRRKKPFPETTGKTLTR